MHIRQQIRQAIATTLTPLFAAGAVHVSRIARIAPGGTPTVVITVPGETAQRGAVLGQFRLQRVITVDISVTLAAAGADDALDAAGETIEAALGAAATLGGLLDSELELTATAIDFDDTAATPAGELRMRYLAPTTVLAAAPGTRA